MKEKTQMKEKSEVSIIKALRKRKSRNNEMEFSSVGKHSEHFPPVACY